VQGYPMTTGPATKWEGWMQSYSEHLGISYKASEPLKHNVTKGQSRENQVLDVLEHVLPRRIAVARNAVVIDSQDGESPMFDGVLMDNSDLPILYLEGGRDSDFLIAMIECAAACIEIKSRLNGKDLADIFSKARKLRSMITIEYGPWPEGPQVVGFAYACPNVALSFFDFSLEFWRNKKSSPSPICVLNQAVFVAFDSGQSHFPRLPTESSLPALIESRGNALLLFVFLLSRGLAGLSPIEEIVRHYSRFLLEDVDVFHFSPAFLDAISSDPVSEKRARNRFLGRPNSSVEEKYKMAAKDLGLREEDVPI
jgi:hypothetical protein